jgi:prolyl oligopeptidase
MRGKLFLVGATLALLAIPCSGRAEDLTYPVTKQVDQVDDYFGTRVADPYRWLEDDRSEETAAWVQAQNQVTYDYLEKIPFRDALKRRMTDIYDYPRYSSPTRIGEYYLFSKNAGLQNQFVIYIQKGLNGEPEIFIDPNALSPDGTVRIGLIGPSGDRRYEAISRSEAGSDWSEIRVVEMATKKELSDRIQWVKFSGAGWWKEGFFYSGFAKPEEGKELSGANEGQRVLYHRLGDPQEKDILVHEDQEHPKRFFDVAVSEDESYAFMTASEGTSGTELYWRDLREPGSSFRLLMKGFDHDSYVVDDVDGKFIVLTNYKAPNKRVVLIDPVNPDESNWTVVIPEKSEALQSASSAGRQLFCSYLKDANTKVYQHDLDGRLVREIALPALGTAYGFHGWRDDQTLFYVFTSFTFPPTIYKLDVAGGASEVFHKSEVRFDPEAYVTKQVFYESKDGTRVPMFIIHRKGLVMDGSNPCYLTSYGGFNISLQPYFSPAEVVLLEQGVIVAQPNLRGGGEYGETWHKAGMLEKKQNVFDDFIAAAEYLVREKYTSSAKLSIAGGSNGGLLVGAVMNQRPELFKVALPELGVLDMLRYHKFTIGWGWAVEYGSSENEKDFKYLYAYSPLHNLKSGVAYPATLVTTGDHDDRVVPAHSFKYIAALQEKQAGPNPALVRIETRSGHGSSNLTKAIDVNTDEFSFFLYNVGAKPAFPAN